MSVALGASSPADHFDSERQAAHALIDLLNQEQAALIGADMDGLALITARKVPVIAEMAELATHRYRALADLGLPPTGTGIQTWIATTREDNPARPAAGKAWADLLALAKQAHEINRINGLLITTHMARNQGALNVLRAQTGSGNFYGPDGQTTTRATTRGLVIG